MIVHYTSQSNVMEIFKCGINRFYFQVVLEIVCLTGCFCRFLIIIDKSQGVCPLTVSKDEGFGLVAFVFPHL